MIFRLVTAVFLCFALASAVHADLTDKQPSYTRIGAKCGADPSKPSFSAADYATAMKDAAKAMKDAVKQGNRARQDAIAQSITQLKECQKEEATKFVVPPMTDCRGFLKGYKAFSARAATLIAAGKITETDRDRVKEAFRKPAEACVRDMMTKCINPNKTSDVDFVIEAMETATQFGFIYTYKKKTGLELFLTSNPANSLRMTFCTETDYACKGSKDICDNRIRRIKAIMQTYVEQ